ncbi:MAG: hypothetical protein WC560_09290 [Syntrophales bacterium]
MIRPPIPKGLPNGTQPAVKEQIIARSLALPFWCAVNVSDLVWRKKSLEIELTYEKIRLL